MDKNVNINRKKKITGCVLLAAGFLLFFLSRNNREFARWYSESIYPVLVESLGRAAGLFPFSVSEILLYLLLTWVVIDGTIRICRFARRRKHSREETNLHSLLWEIFVLASLLFFLYMANCGVNYYRDSFADASGITTEEYSAEELEEVCLWLTEEVNRLSGQVLRDEEGVMQLAGEGEELRSAAGADVEEDAVKAMQELGDRYEALDGYYPKPKGLLVPWILSVQQLSGVYSPFTVEANYNTAMADYYIPFTMCHELSHLRGFMEEKEANFIGFLACRQSERAEFQYSGNLVGWTYCMNVLYKVDYKKWETVRAKLSDEVEPDLRANREFWDAYDSAVAEVSNKINDTYLKANGQSDGVKSYDKMVDLMVAYYKGL